MRTIVTVIAVCAVAVGTATVAYLHGKSKNTAYTPEENNKKKGGVKPGPGAVVAEETQEGADAEHGQEKPEAKLLHSERQVYRQQAVEASMEVNTSRSAESEPQTGKEGKEPAERGGLWRYRKLLLISGAIVLAGAVVWLNRGAIVDFFFIGRNTVKTTIDTAGEEAVIRVVANPVKDVTGKAVPETASKIINVSFHFRKLPQGWKVSAEKIAEAARLGIELPPGFTFVDGYSKTAAA